MSVIAKRTTRCRVQKSFFPGRFRCHERSDCSHISGGRETRSLQFKIKLQSGNLDSKRQDGEVVQATVRSKWYSRVVALLRHSSVVALKRTSLVALCMAPLGCSKHASPTDVFTASEKLGRLLNFAFKSGSR